MHDGIDVVVRRGGLQASFKCIGLANGVDIASVVGLDGVMGGTAEAYLEYLQVLFCPSWLFVVIIGRCPTHSLFCYDVINSEGLGDNLSVLILVVCRPFRDAAFKDGVAVELRTVVIAPVLILNA